MCNYTATLNKVIEMAYNNGIVTKQYNTYKFNAFKFLHFIIRQSSDCKDIMDLKNNIFDSLRAVYKKTFIDCFKYYKQAMIDYYGFGNLNQSMVKVKDKLDNDCIAFKFTKMCVYEVTLNSIAFDDFLQQLEAYVKDIADKDAMNQVQVEV